MCRSGGRRCKGSHTSSRATQNARQQRSRARRALRQARAAGDDNAVQQAQQRLDDANAILKRHKENPVSNHDSHADDQQPQHDTARQHGDVTNIVHGENNGYQTDVINGGLTFHASTGRFTIGNNGGDGSARNDSAYAQERARYQEERARYQQERAQYRAERAAQPHGDGSNVHTGPRGGETGGTGPVHITDRDGNTFMQAGNVHGGIWVNGKRVG